VLLEKGDMRNREEVRSTLPLLQVAYAAPQLVDANQALTVVIMVADCYWTPVELK
jgi:hypothetical protein